MKKYNKQKLILSLKISSIALLIIGSCICVYFWYKNNKKCVPTCIENQCGSDGCGGSCCDACEYIKQSVKIIKTLDDKIINFDYKASIALNRIPTSDKDDYSNYSSYLKVFINKINFNCSTENQAIVILPEFYKILLKYQSIVGDFFTKLYYTYYEDIGSVDLSKLTPEIYDSDGIKVNSSNVLLLAKSVYEAIVEFDSVSEHRITELSKYYWRLV
jgi:hypothetical protein